MEGGSWLLVVTIAAILLLFIGLGMQQWQHLYQIEVVMEDLVVALAVEESRCTFVTIHFALCFVFNERSQCGMCRSACFLFHSTML